MSRLRVLLYVGAFTDTYPLTVPALRKTHTHMVYVDGMPDSGYYKQHATTTADMLRLAVQEGGQYCFADKKRNTVFVKRIAWQVNPKIFGSIS